MPAVVVPVLIASAAVAVPFAANAAVTLPTKTPAQVLALIAGEKVTALSGTLSQTSSLGLPELPTTGADASSGSALELLTGSHTARVFVDGTAKQRVQVFDRMAERDLVRNGSDVWLYDSKKKTAVHSTLGERALGTSKPEGSIPTPDQLAATLLKSVDSTTIVSLGSDLRVAGHPAYNLVLTPKASENTARVRLDRGGLRNRASPFSRTLRAFANDTGVQRRVLEARPRHAGREPVHLHSARRSESYREGAESRFHSAYGPTVTGREADHLWHRMGFDRRHSRRHKCCWQEEPLRDILAAVWQAHHDRDRGTSLPHEPRQHIADG